MQRLDYLIYLFKGSCNIALARHEMIGVISIAGHRQRCFNRAKVSFEQSIYVARSFYIGIRFGFRERRIYFHNFLRPIQTEKSQLGILRVLIDISELNAPSVCRNRIRHG